MQKSETGEKKLSETYQEVGTGTSDILIIIIIIIIIIIK